MNYQLFHKKHGALLKQSTKYFGVALVGYVFDFGTLVLLHEVFHIHYLLAASAGFVIGLAVVYMGSSRFVFGESKITSKFAEFGLFAIIGLVGLGMLNGIMFLLTGLIGINYIVSKITATVVVYGWNFFARRTLYHS